EPDCTGGGKYGGLGVAVSVLFPEFECSVPRGVGGLQQGIGGTLLIEGDGEDAEAFVFVVWGGVGGTPVVSNHAQHIVLVSLVAFEWPELFGEFCACGVGFA